MSSRASFAVAVLAVFGLCLLLILNAPAVVGLAAFAVLLALCLGGTRTVRLAGRHPNWVDGLVAVLALALLLWLLGFSVTSNPR